MIVLFACVCALAGAHAQTGPSVNTSQGVIIGSNNPDGYFSFYGIHYAGSTAGANRFKAPTPPPVYPGEYHAIDSNIICAQPTSRGLIGVEDCLVLNIHTPNFTSPKPVIVWIEGENYESSSTMVHSFRNLVKEDLVVVSMNYRRSIFGFLCLGVHGAPGNAGLRDILQGLKWIQVNIANFGGDPFNVVLMGHSSGAAMVDLLTLSPQASGLIHKAIILSGSALSPWAVAYNPIHYAEAVGEKLGYTDKSREELATLLSTTEINLLNNVLREFEFYNNTPLFAPCVENIELNPNDTVIPDAPLNILRSGNYSHMPIIAGYTDREGTLKAEQAVFHDWLSKMQSNFSDFLPADLRFPSAENRTGNAQTIREFYFAQRVIDMGTIQDFLDYQGDTLILAPVIRGIKERARTSTAQVRLFEFAFRGTRNSDWAYPQIPLTGVRHGGILNYVFDFDLTDEDTSAKRSIVSRFAFFARTGEQNSNVTLWDPVTTSMTHMLYISGGDVTNNDTFYKEEARSNLNKERTDFWDNIYASYYVAPSSVSSATNVFSFAFIVIVGQLLITLL